MVKAGSLHSIVDKKKKIKLFSCEWHFTDLDRLDYTEKLFQV